MGDDELFYPDQEQRWLQCKCDPAVVHPDILKFNNRWVTVLSWHENIASRERFPNSDTVGFVKEFHRDVPKEELLMFDPNREDLTDGQR